MDKDQETFAMGNEQETFAMGKEHEEGARSYEYSTESGSYIQQSWVEPVGSFNGVDHSEVESHQLPRMLNKTCTSYTS